MSQSTIDRLRWPARLSQIKMRRKGGKDTQSSGPNQVVQRAASGRSVSAVVTSGSAATIALSSAWSQGWRIVFGALLTPLPRTSPVAGRKRVSNFAVPFLTYSCGCRAGFPSGSQLSPGYGLV